MGDSASITISGLERNDRVPGDQAQLRVLIETLDGLQVAPDTLVISYRPPGEEVVEKTLGTDPEVQTVDPGDYALDVPLTVAGTWYFRVRIGGNLVGAAEASLSVAESQVIADT